MSETKAVINSMEYFQEIKVEDLKKVAQGVIISDKGKNKTLL